MKQEYFSLFNNYKGKVNILTYNYNKYKFSIFYRIKLLKKLNSLNLNTVFNITAARGILNDEITLLSGARRKYTTCNNLKYLGQFIGNKMNNEYDDIFYKEEKNEYDKHILLLKYLSIKEPIFFNIKSFDTLNYSDFLAKKEYDKNNYILISPLPSDLSKSWGIENYKNLCSELIKKYKIILIGSPGSIDSLQYISGGNSYIQLETCELEYIPSVIANAKLFIGNDSGLTHLALKLNRPLIAIISGAYFKMYFPYKEEPGKFVYLYNIQDCYECHSECIYKSPLCLTNIKLNRVMEEIEKILQ
jgi:ADP-heptose:LPS heptosyltransferase